MAAYAGVTFLAAFLLFFVQPMLAKAVLPWFGGAAAVWTTSLVFYQTLLLAGYLYAHLSRRLSLRSQVTLHAVVLLATLFTLPILPTDAWKPTGTEEPTLHLLVLLAASVGAPYLLLASTSPLLHDWFGRLFPGRSPYVLYAVSNAGSLLALLAYPFAVEPLLTVDAQAVGWTAGYGLFVAGVLWIAVRAARTTVPAASDVSQPVPATGGAPPGELGRVREEAPGGVARPGRPNRQRVAIWFALAACGSGLLLAITNQITLDIASVPLLWVLPLALYLATFIVAFAGVYDRVILGSALALGLGLEVLVFAEGASLPIAAQIAIGCGVLVAACWLCHGELARSAPPPRHLTAFYLTMSAGGAAGGAAVSLLAPLVFPDLWELPLFLLGAWALLGVVMWTDPESRLSGGARSMAWRGIVLVGVAAAAGFAFPEAGREAGTIASERNFYGVVRVLEGETAATGPVRALRHGRIIHGSQLLDPERSGTPTTYYARGSGVDVAMSRHPRRSEGSPLRVGAIGEGVGTVAALGERGDTVRFYEINPAVVRLAGEYFDFVDGSPAEVEVVLGDGRLALERDVAAFGEGIYDVLVVDAFSGDGIPTHLLTREAAELYWRALGPDGVVAFHITNRHMDVTPVVRAMAEHTGHEVLRVVRDSEERLDVAVSHWLLVVDDPAPYLIGGVTREPDEPSRLWTDRFSNLLHVLR